MLAAGLQWGPCARHPHLRSWSGPLPTLPKCSSSNISSSSTSSNCNTITNTSCNSSTTSSRCWEDQELAAAVVVVMAEGSAWEGSLVRGSSSRFSSNSSSSNGTTVPATGPRIGSTEEGLGTTGATATTTTGIGIGTEDPEEGTSPLPLPGTAAGETGTSDRGVPCSHRHRRLALVVAVGLVALLPVGNGRGVLQSPCPRPRPAAGEEVAGTAARVGTLSGNLQQPPPPCPGAGPGAHLAASPGFPPFANAIALPFLALLSVSSTLMRWT